MKERRMSGDEPVSDFRDVHALWRFLVVPDSRVGVQGPGSGVQGPGVGIQGPGYGGWDERLGPSMSGVKETPKFSGSRGFGIGG